MTKQLNKNEEKDINNEIMILKRKIREAESSGNIEIRLEQAEDLKDELDEQIDRIKKEKDPIDKEYNALKDELDKKNQHITGLKNVSFIPFRNWLLKRTSKVKKKIVMIKSMNLGKKTRKSDLISLKRKSPR